MSESVACRAWVGPSLGPAKAEEPFGVWGKKESAMGEEEAAFGVWGPRWAPRKRRFRAEAGECAGGRGRGDGWAEGERVRSRRGPGLGQVCGIQW